MRRTSDLSICLERLVTAQHVAELLPGHGPIVTDPMPWLSFYRRHRLERLDQVRAALAAGDRTPSEVVARVYADVDRSVWPAAEQSVRSQLEYLRERAKQARQCGKSLSQLILASQDAHRVLSQLSIAMNANQQPGNQPQTSDNLRPSVRMRSRQSSCRVVSMAATPG